MEGVNLTIILVSLLILFSRMDFKHKIIQWNCRGLKPNFNEVSLLISEYNPSVFCFQETFLKPDDNISLKGFNIYNYVHTDCLRPSGGASVFVKSSFPQRKIDLQTELQATAVSVTLDKEITICSVYIPPSFSLNSQHLDSLLQQLPSPYIILGDLGEKALLTLHVVTEMHFFTSEKPKKYHAWSCQNVCDALTFLLDNIFIRFGTKLYRQVVGIPMGTNCAPLVADLFLFCYERDFMMSLSDDKQADVIDAFNTTSRYLDDILNINNVYFDNMVSQIYPSELQLNKANASDTEAAFLDLHLSISNDIVSTKIYDKRDDFDFEIVNFPFLDGDVPRSTSYGVYISQLIRFARASSYVVDFNTRNKLLTQKLLKQGYRYHKLRKTFSKFYRRYYDLISKFQVGLKSLLRQGLS